MAFVACATIAEAFNNVPESISASISLKVPGNGAKHYPLTFQKSQNNNGTYYLENSEKMPLTVSQNIVTGNDGLRISVSITALEDVYFNYNQQMATGFRHDDCPGRGPGAEAHRLQHHRGRKPSPAATLMFRTVTVKPSGAPSLVWSQPLRGDAPAGVGRSPLGRG